MKWPGDNDPIDAPSLQDSTLDDTRPSFADIVLTSGSTAARSALRAPKDHQGQQKKGYFSTLMSAFVDNPSPDAPSPEIDNVLAARQSGKGGDSHLSEETPSLLRRLLFFSSSSSEEEDPNPSSRNASPRSTRKSTASTNSGVSTTTPILKKVEDAEEKFSDADSFTRNTMYVDQNRASGDHATDLLKEDVTASDDKNSIGFASMVSWYFSSF